MEELREFIAIPSVSADPAHADDVRRAAEWVRDFVKRIGGEAELVPYGERDLVIGDIPANANGGAADAPTVMIYGHFDVQPPSPLELWETPPFELAERDGWYYARGIADDKGQLFTLLKAAQLLREQNALPVNIRIVSDGEEEIGGHSVVDFLEADERGADVCIIFDGGMTRPEQPEFGLATRGLVAFQLKVKTGDRDMHSGYYGGAALNAIHVLMQALSAVVAGTACCRTRSASGREALSQARGRQPQEPAEGRGDPRRSGCDAARSEGGRRLLRPDLGRAVARRERHPGRQARLRQHDPDRRGGRRASRCGWRRARIPRRSRRRSRGSSAPRCPTDASVEIDSREQRRPGVFSPDSPAIQLGMDAFEKATGVRPLLVRVGGTLPIYPALAAKGIPTIGTGFALRESNVHSPNERLRVEDIDRAVAAATELYKGLAALA